MKNYENNVSPTKKKTINQFQNFVQKNFPNNFDDICVENRPWGPLKFCLQTHSPNCAFYKFYKETCKNTVFIKLIALAFIQTTNTIVAKSAPDMYCMYICTRNGFEKQVKSPKTQFLILYK